VSTEVFPRNSRTILAVATDAGGTGKSTTAVTLAALLAEQGKQVLLIDTDAQGTATEWLGITKDTCDLTISEVLKRKCTLDEATVDTNTPNLRLVPANVRMHECAAELPGVRGGEARLRRALRDGGDADVVIIDCPGSLSIVTTAALVAADNVLTVSLPTRKELSAIPSLESAVMDVVEDYQPGLTFAGIVPCQVPPDNQGQIYRDALQLMRQVYADLVAPPVRRAAKVAEAQGQSTPLPAHAPRAKATEDYRTVLQWLQDRGVL